MENKKKICFIASTPGGIVSFFRTNFEKISEVFDVYVISNFSDKSVFNGLSIEDAYSVKIERRPTIWGNLKALMVLYKLFKKERFDGFVSMSSNASLLASVAGYCARVPHRIRIFTGQLWANSTGFKRQFFKTIDRITVALNTELLVDSKPQREYLIQERVLKFGRAEVLANGSICGVDTVKFVPCAEIRKEEREKNGIADNVVAFSFMGRINRDKGTFELLGASNKLFGEVDNVVLVLIGNMEGLTPEVLKDYPNLKVGENVILYGYTKEPYKSLQLSDVFCLPSYREGFGMSAIEAASLGLPVICSDVYGLKDSFVPNETGLMCKAKDVETLCDCMRRLYNDSSLRQKLGINGRNRVVEKFDKEQVSTAWKEFLKQTI